MKGIFAGLALLLALTGPGAAQQTTSPDTTRGHAPADTAASWHAALPERPTVATHAYTVAPRVVEIEAGIQAMRPAGAAMTAMPVVLKYGVARGLQVELIGGWSHQSTAARPAVGNVPATPASHGDGFEDLAVAPKIRVLYEAPVLANFSVQPSLKFPTGALAQGTGTGTTDVGLLLISSRNLGPVSLDLNAGITRRSGNGRNAPRTATFLTQSWGFPVHGPLAWVAELFDFPGTSGPAGTPPQVGLLTGPTFTVRPWIVLDAGVIGNVHGFPANSLYAGVTWNAGRIP